jgi:hypothetical protein
MSYAVKRPPSVWLVVIRTNVFLPYSYTLHVCRTFILYCRRLMGRRWLGSMEKTMIGEECLPSTLELCILLRKGPWTTWTCEIFSIRLKLWPNNQFSCFSKYSMFTGVVNLTELRSRGGSSSHGGGYEGAVRKVSWRAAAATNDIPPTTIIVHDCFQCTCVTSNERECLIYYQHGRIFVR